MGRKRPARGSGAAKVTAAILTEIPITATDLIIMPERIRSDVILHDVCGMCRSRTVEGREEEPQR